MTTRNQLQGKVALVTGASGGIGSAIANELAAEAATLALAYGSNQEAAEALAAEITNRGGRAIAIGRATENDRPRVRADPLHVVGRSAHRRDRGTALCGLESGLAW